MPDKSVNAIEDRSVFAPVLAHVVPSGELSLLQDVNDTILTDSRQAHVISGEDGVTTRNLQLGSSTSHPPSPTPNFLYCQQSAVNCTF